MRLILFIVVSCSFISNLFAAAELSERQQASIARQYRRSMRLDDVVTMIKKGEVDAKRLGIIRAVLHLTVEKHIHQQRGATENQVWLHENGHNELVVRPNGDKFSHVRDGINDGSYNYFHPTEDAIRHYFYDINPWILLGYDRNDPTTQKERLAAYVLDLEEGLILASKSGTFLPVDVGSLRVGEAEAFGIFLTVFDKAGVNDVYVLIENKTILDPSTRTKILSAIEAGFGGLYTK